MSAFSDALCIAAQGPTGMTTGEPHEPVRTSWADVHAKACAGARVLAAHGIGPGDAVAVLAAKPFEVAPIAQAAWLAGASVTMLHQPTARTNLMTYAQDTAAVLSLVGAKAAVLGDPFTEFAELLDGSGVLALTVDDLLAEPGGPAPDVEIGEDLAKEKGIRHGDRVKVRSNRGEVVAACVVTKRMKGLDVDGKKVHHVGIPIHWGFKGVTQNGYLANALTPFVGDANSQTPEFKAFLVNIEKVG